MLISNETGSTAAKIGEKKAIELFAKAGFTAWDFSLFDRNRYIFSENKVLGPDGKVLSTDLIKYAKELKKVSVDNGIVCNQSHAPFPSHVLEIRDSFKKVLEMSAEVGAKICVIHPCNNYTAEENAEMYRELLPYAKEFGVKIATENMWNWDSVKDEALPAACSDEESFVKHVDAVGDDYLVACLDIGHAEMRGLNTNAVALIKALGNKRLKALQIHDNDLHYDCHERPMTMGIDFKAVVKALKEIDYDGDFTLEVDTRLTGVDDKTVLEKLTKVANSGKKLLEMFQNL